MKITKIRMLKQMCGHILMDKIRNKKFKEKLQVARISAKMLENKLRRV